MLYAIIITNFKGKKTMTNNGSLETALRGEYYFTLKEIFKKAWMLTRGSKLIFNISLLIYILLAIILQKIISLIVNPQIYYASHDIIKAILADETQSLLSLPIIAPITAGIVMLGVKRSALKKITIASIFNYYTIMWSLVFASIFVSLATLAGFVFFIIPGIYLAVAFSFTTPLIADKRLGIFQAMKTSLLAVHKQWFKFFTIYASLIVMVLMAILFTFGIALIWLLPFIFIVNGILYKTVFGYTNFENTEDDG